MNFKTHLVLLILCGQYALSQSITITPNSSGTNTEGKMYYENASHSYRYWNGTSFVPLGGSGGSNWSVQGDEIYRKSKVGVGTDSPKTDLHVGTVDDITGVRRGVIRSEQSIELPDTAYIAFGKDSPQSFASDRGRIGYNLTGKNALTIIGSNQAQIGKSKEEKLWFEAKWGSTFNGPLSIVADNRDALLTVERNSKEIFAVKSTNLVVYTGGYGFTGTSLISKNGATGEAKMGFNNIGAEMLLSSTQNIAHATSTKLNFNDKIFDHNNNGPFNNGGTSLNVADEINDNFTARAIGIYLVDFTVNWVDPDIDFGGTGLRNGRIRVKVNGVMAREFVCDLNIHENCFIYCSEGDVITVEAYHEHCFDPPPVCITGIGRAVSNARVTVMKF
jgi:hypothetical protein